MNLDRDGNSELSRQLQVIAAEIRSLAHSHQGDSLALLALLRALEQTHREIRENLFQAALPDSRQRLYALLKDIEEEGGWPYIERMTVRSLRQNLQESGACLPDGDSERLDS
jgi:hypothetical protein